MNAQPEQTPAPRTRRAHGRQRGRRAVPRSEYDRWRALADTFGREKMTPEELSELRLLTLRLGGKRAVRAIGLR